MINELNPKHLNCNFFNVYDYGDLSMNELLCHFFSKINELIKEHNEINDIVEYLVSEGLKKEVAETLIKWLNDGTITELIAENLYTELWTRVNKREGVLFQNNEPVDVCQLKMDFGVVNQSIAVDKRNYDMFITQKVILEDDKETNIESFYLYRMDYKGNIKDKMIFKHGGHGVNIGLEIENDEIYIWNSWYINNPPIGLPNSECRYRLGRCKYQPNRTIDRDDETIQYFDVAKQGFFIPTIDSNCEYMALRYYMDVHIFKLKDVKNNDFSKSQIVNVDMKYYYLQGFHIDSDFLYWRSGDVRDPENQAWNVHPDVLTKWDIKTGELIEEKELKYNKLQDVHEPEGIYVMEKNNQKVMYLTTMTGGRYARLFNVQVLGNSNELSNTIINLGQSYNMADKYCLPTGKVKWIDPSTTELKNFKEYGIYYIDTALAKQITDMPFFHNDGAWFLEVSPLGKYENTYFQRLTRVSNSIHGFGSCSRMIIDDTCSAWGGNALHSVLWTGNTATNKTGTFELKDSIKNYDFVVFEYKSYAGGNSEDRILTTANMDGQNVIHTFLNFADSSFTVWTGWKHWIQFNADFTTFEVKRQAEYVLNNGAMSGNADTTNWGLLKITGIRV